MKQSLSKQYASYEESHWWCRARRRILRNLISQESLKTGVRLLEIGAASGVNLYSIYPSQVEVVGLEPDADNAALARKRGAHEVVCADIFSAESHFGINSFDCICLFDVLEHIEHDEAAMRAVSSLLRPGGKVLVSVPAFQFLWGRQDVASEHKRRYTKKTINRCLIRAGYDVKRVTYFNTILFPFIALCRINAHIFGKGKHSDTSDFEMNLGMIENILYGLFLFESVLLKYMNFPVGVSIYISARKADR
jgi:2-polyprenyl-3-methyl-5-hydroxy-6-metoxy-1,4-benzoquinol methylase